MVWPFDNGGAFQADLRYHGLDEAGAPAGQGDQTKYTSDITLRYEHQLNDRYSLGGFIGTGKQNDYGDSDRDMTYDYSGMSLSYADAKIPWTVFLGVLDGEDEYDEAPQDGVFLGLNMGYVLSEQSRLVFSASFLDAKKYSSRREMKIVDLGVEYAYQFENSPFEGFASFNVQDSTFESGPTWGDRFTTINVGVRMSFGKKPGIAPLPDFGAWSAYQANEIE